MPLVIPRVHLHAPPDHSDPRLHHTSFPALSPQPQHRHCQLSPAHQQRRRILPLYLHMPSSDPPSPFSNPSPSLVLCDGAFPPTDKGKCKAVQNSQEVGMGGEPGSGGGVNLPPTPEAAASHTHPKPIAIKHLQRKSIASSAASGRQSTARICNRGTKLGQAAAHNPVG